MQTATALCDTPRTASSGRSAGLGDVFVVVEDSDREFAVGIGDVAMPGGAAIPLSASEAELERALRRVRPPRAARVPMAAWAVCPRRRAQVRDGLGHDRPSRVCERAAR